MRPLLTADVLNTCSQEYEEREEEMDTVIEKIFKKLNSCTTLELHFTVRYEQSCISLYLILYIYGCFEYPDCTVWCMVRICSVYMGLLPLPVPNIQSFIILYMAHEI